MTESASAAEFVPDSRSLRTLRQAAGDCRGCGLWRDATQTVFGAGPRKAKLMLVGEQPGDREDVEGEPFVGPAGGILAWALQSAEIDRDEVYLTNAVKHFKWRGRGRQIDSALAPVAALTLHPSAILRLRDHEEREWPSTADRSVEDRRSRQLSAPATARCSWALLIFERPSMSSFFASL